MLVTSYSNFSLPPTTPTPFSLLSWCATSPKQHTQLYISLNACQDLDWADVLYNLFPSEFFIKFNYNYNKIECLILGA